MQEKRPHLAEKNVLCHQINGPVHTSVIMMAKINEFKLELLAHTSYSPNFAPSDYFLLPNLKKWLGGDKFANNDKVKSAVNSYFEKLNGSHYKRYWRYWTLLRNNRAKKGLCWKIICFQIVCMFFDSSHHEDYFFYSAKYSIKYDDRWHKINTI